jgi:hypothetical protein
MELFIWYKMDNHLLPIKYLNWLIQYLNVKNKLILYGVIHYIKIIKLDSQFNIPKKQKQKRTSDNINLELIRLMYLEIHF